MNRHVHRRVTAVTVGVDDGDFYRIGQGGIVGRLGMVEVVFEGVGVVGGDGAVGRLAISVDAHRSLTRIDRYRCGGRVFQLGLGDRRRAAAVYDEMIQSVEGFEGEASGGDMRIIMQASVTQSRLIDGGVSNGDLRFVVFAFDGDM